MQWFDVYELWEQRKTKTGDVNSFVVEDDSAAPTWDKDIEALGQERQLEAEYLPKPPLRYIITSCPAMVSPIVTNGSSSHAAPVPTSPVHAGFVREKVGPVNHLDEVNRHRVRGTYGLGAAGKTQFCVK
ncbi:MAG: hypothetical protein ALECFALPRED_003874 [Alectoria fallacina]|uniref:Uncharacterized protein n=1 Tax=Alectoria fallacina TaxID=1903189 RepID=A0A8H3ENQ8_9LECA|nr:MAG: hypothetical protein ALECFALPRED_003874 [Alectoria fallacina]